MDNYSLNSDSELLYMTLDGEADEIQSSILFRKLAEDTELQKEFRDAVRINHGAVKETENIVPSGKLTNNIFSTLNIGSATAPAISGKSISGINKITQLLFNRWPVAIISGIVCSLITYFILSSSSQNQSPVKVYTYQASVVSNQPEIIEKITPEINANDGNFSSGNNIPTVKFDEKSKNENEPAGLMNKNVGTMDEKPGMPNLWQVQVIKNTDFPAVRRISDEDSGINEDFLLRNESMNIENYDNSDDIQDEYPYYISIGAFNQNALKFYPDRDLNIGNEPLFNNSGLNISWLIDESNSIGIEYSQETLPMYIGGDAITDPYYPRKSLVFFGINYTHIFNSLEIINNLRPYLKNSVSGCKIGMSFKPEAGLIWNPADRVQVFLAADGNILVYRNNLDVFKTIKKVGLRYGINLLF